ncbi:MAG TPA: AAA family ATPase [Acidimicrobiales bacterium]|nr:AAA family ATPase [Acidimicrobiales bacterium]
MFLSKIVVEGFRAANAHRLECVLPGRFAVLLGANGSGKSTVADAITIAHPEVFPSSSRVSSAALSKTLTDRSILIEYAYEDTETIDLWRMRKSQGPAPHWVTSLTPSLGRIATNTLSGNRNEFASQLPVMYLSPSRNPTAELAGRNAQLIVELLRSESLRSKGTRSLAGLRKHLGNLVATLISEPPLAPAEDRVAAALRNLTVGVSLRTPYLATTEIDDAIVARVFEFLLSALGDGRELSHRLEVEGLGYANLLQVAVVLAAIPDLTHPQVTAPVPGGDGGSSIDDEAAAESAGSGTAGDQEDDRTEEERRAELADAEENQRALDESLFPEQFHALVLLEEPEAHLHPQLQYGLVRYLRDVVRVRPELQVILTTHSDEIVAACDPEELVVFRRLPSGESRSIAIKALDLPIADLAQMRRHLDVSRSASLFADRMVLVEGVTDAMLVRAFGRAWSSGDEDKQHFIDALTITVVGSRIGQWLPNLLTAPDKEVVTRVAVLMDSDGGGLPQWATDRRGEHFDAFLSDPTLEPSVVVGNEALIEAVFDELGYAKPWVAGESPTAGDIAAWVADKGRRRKAEFAMAFSALIEADSERTVVPTHLRDLLDFVYGQSSPAAEPPPDSPT